MPTLYRKYRPAVFEDVTGQDTIVQTIQNELSNDKLSHAYLFSGPRGVGKTTLARLLAKAVSCEKRKKGTFEPCNECSACEQINKGRHIDIIEIDAASQTGVDNVRENIIENAGVMPTTLKKKIFIIDEVHMLSTSAFNALLKTLEEPPSHVIFILATTELHKLPATVISRCERFNFKKIAFEKIVERLKKLCTEEKVKIDKEVIERIARKSDGGLRDAESLLGQILSLDLKEISTDDIQIILPLSSTEHLIKYLENLVEDEPGKSIELINTILDEGVDLLQFSHDLLDIERTALVLSLNADKNSVNADFSEETLKQLKKFGDKLGREKLVVIMDLTLKRKAEIKYAPLPQLPLELLAVEIAELVSAVPTAPHTPEKVIHIAKAPESKPEQKEKPIQKIEIEETIEIKNPIAQITETIKTAFTQISSGTAKTTLEELQNKWKQVIEKSSEKVPSLSFILTACVIKELDGNNIVLAVPFSIHKDRLETAKNKQVLEECLENMFGEKLHISPIVEEMKAPAPKETDVSGIAAEFGGEVVG